MKSKLVVFGMLLSLAGVSARAEGKEVDIAVKGMVCGFCAQGIEKKFHAQSSVDQVKVDLGQKRVRLTLKNGQSMTDDAIRNILTESGYNVEKIERK
jgi:mercuric ion binding protein